MGDVEMDDATTVPGAAPPPGNPLFLAATPSAAGTPAHQRSSHAPDSTPLRGITARRALGMQTPKRTPLFMRKKTYNSLSEILLLIDASLADSSSPMALPSSSPAKTPQRRPTRPSDMPLDSDPLDFPT